MIELVLILSFCFFGVQAQVPVLAKCPEVSVQENFDLNKYLGTWYEEEKYFAIFEVDARCVAAEYSLNENGTVKVLNTQIDKLTGKKSSIEGSAKAASSSGEGKFAVNFPGRGFQADAPYWVLETDYENYSVVWSCVDITPPISARFAWILTRERNPSQDVVNKAQAVLDRLNISRKEMIKTDQTNLNRLDNKGKLQETVPIRDQLYFSASVIVAVTMTLKLFLISAIFICEIWCQVPFFGKCPDVDVQKNFDLNKYTGRWYEAEKYFANFELGKKCIFADYSVFENGTMRVLNQDINSKTQKKSSIEGNARLAGKPDEAKLLVNFPARGARVDAPYWILETDYDNYAVVWACSEYPRVSTKYAWILTRKRNQSEDILNKAYNVFERLNLSKKDLFKTDQTDCPIDE
ncbi:uncharacterized protein LOC123683308 [Harmonia axyridis]|uniref:uncharacterized protein LOC123683308 n=1 Tax=Harmonia axyridis TaxID=115357 RepID=UPI001E2795C2|nr:uncharacterized protein LOC123683308 [Harmonia axyridis]